MGGRRCDVPTYVVLSDIRSISVKLRASLHFNGQVRGNPCRTRIMLLCEIIDIEILQIFCSHPANEIGRYRSSRQSYDHDSMASFFCVQHSAGVYLSRGNPSERYHIYTMCDLPCFPERVH